VNHFKKLLIRKANFYGRKTFFFKTEIKISTFQNAGRNLNGARDMLNSKFNCSFTLADMMTALVHTLALSE